MGIVGSVFLRSLDIGLKLPRLMGKLTVALHKEKQKNFRVLGFWGFRVLEFKGLKVFRALGRRVSEF